MAYRGQPNAEYGLSSSLFRLCRTHVERVTEELMERTEARIIGAMRQEGLGRLMMDGELLAVLQHHGIPTRLIDVSVRPKEALFFAVDRDDDFDGRLFAIQLHPKNGKLDKINLDGSSDLPWKGSALGTRYSKSAWTNRVAIAEPMDLDPRMRAQRGRFLVGGLAASNERQRMQYQHRRLTAVELSMVTRVIEVDGSSACRVPFGWLRSVIAGVGSGGCESRRPCGLRV
ncbi:FRG domain-containing protein [Streptacidiphilus sp. PAMC 29251]